MITNRILQKSPKIRLTLALIVMVALTGCSTTTQFSSVQSGIAVNINQKNRMTPTEESFKDKTFGSYEFKATHEKYPPLHGTLPLKFNTTYLILDIIFFTPLLFVNLNKVYHYYEFDLEKRLVKYKNNENDPWQISNPFDDKADNIRAASSQTDKAEGLKKLKALLDDGLISKEEYNLKRAKIIEAL